MVHDTLPSKDASTHLIWNSYRSFAPVLIQILETRSQAKVKVTGKWKGTIRNSKMHSHSKLSSKMHLHTEFLPQRISDMCSIIQLFLKLAQRSRSKWLEYDTWHSAIPRCIYTPNLEFLSQRNRRYAPDSKQFLETRSEVKVNVTGSQGNARHFFIPRCIHIPNLGFLPQII